jgi:hypothetical protein
MPRLRQHRTFLSESFPYKRKSPKAAFAFPLFQPTCKINYGTAAIQFMELWLLGSFD